MVLEQSESAATTDVVENTMHVGELEAVQSPGSDEQDLPLPQEPTLPAVPESSNDAVPEYLDLDTVAEADIYTVGCTQPVTEQLASGDVHNQPMIECFALALPFEELAAEVENELASIEFVFDDEDIGEEDTEDSDEPQVEALDSKDVIQQPLHTLTPNALLHVEDGVDRPRKQSRVEYVSSWS